MTTADLHGNENLKPHGRKPLAPMTTADLHGNEKPEATWPEAIGSMGFV